MLIDTVYKKLRHFHKSHEGIHLIDYILLIVTAVVLGLFLLTFLANRYA
jgi:hypothetical protein